MLFSVLARVLFFGELGEGLVELLVRRRHGLGHLRQTRMDA